jgi:hypothetical protein
LIIQLLQERPASSSTRRHTSPLPNCIIESLKAVKFIDNKHFNITSSVAAIQLVAGRESVIAHILWTILKKVYNLSFAIGDAKNGCHGDMMVVAKDTLKALFKSVGKEEWKTMSTKFKAI